MLGIAVATMVASIAAMNIASSNPAKTTDRCVVLSCNEGSGSGTGPGCAAVEKAGGDALSVPDRSQLPEGYHPADARQRKREASDRVSRRMCFWILPIAFRGSDSTWWISFGFLKPASRARQ